MDRTGQAEKRAARARTTHRFAQGSRVHALLHREHVDAFRVVHGGVHHGSDARIADVVCAATTTRPTRLPVMVGSRRG